MQLQNYFYFVFCEIVSLHFVSSVLTKWLPEQRLKPNPEDGNV